MLDGLGKYWAKFLRNSLNYTKRFTVAPPYIENENNALGA